MASKHSRKPSSRAALPRRMTRGPLDEDYPLSASITPVASPPTSSLASPLSSALQSGNASFQASELPSPSLEEPVVDEPVLEEKDLSFLLDPSIYHPLSQLDLPAPFRRPFPPLPTPNTPFGQSIAQLDALLQTSDFLSAAHLAGCILTSSSLKSTDVKTIFRLLSVRYSCLELTGNTLFAAQESKALEDLASTFYYYEPPAPNNLVDSPENDAFPPEHIMPFQLRLQALRLQSIGFSDPRRGVSALYDLGIECRDNIASSQTTDAKRKVWTDRLAELGVRVVNALIEMSDLDCASRTLESMKPAEPESSVEWCSRLLLLHLKIGDITKARQILDQISNSEDRSAILEPMLAVVEGRYEEAAKMWEQQLQRDPESEIAVLIKQNLAVAYLYAGEIIKARDTMTGLVDAGNAFESLTMNLATLYELSSDRSKDLKLAMAGRVAKQLRNNKDMAPKANAAFKL